jgi:hypothetical protein
MRISLGGRTGFWQRREAMQFGPWAVFGMFIRGAPVRELWRAARLIKREQLPTTLDELEIHHLAGGDIERVLQAALAARRRGLPDNLPALIAADLAGEDLQAFLDRGYVFKAQLERQRLWREAPHDPRAAHDLAQLLRRDLQRCHESVAEFPDSGLVGEDLRRRFMVEIAEVIKRRDAELAKVKSWLGSDQPA